VSDGTGVRTTRGSWPSRCLGFAALAAVAATPRPCAGAGATLAGVRVELGGYLEADGVVPTDSNGHRQRPAGALRLAMEVQPAQELKLFLSATGLVGGTPEEAAGAGIFDLERAIQNRSPSFEFEEAYLDWHHPDVDLRIGKQKFAWGKLDGIQLNDWLNPEKYYDPLLTDEDERKIGVPALAASFFPPPPRSTSELRLTAVWVPVHVPFRFPDRKERWFPPLAVPPPTFRNQGRIHQRLAVENGGEGPRGLDDGNVALRLTGLSAGTDWGLYYYDGFDPLPLFDVHSREGDGSTLEIVETPAFRRFRTGGADAAWTTHGLTFRAEVSYQERRAFSRNVKRDLGIRGDIPDTVFPFFDKVARGETAPAFVERDAFSWGAGVDYPVAGWLPIVQVLQTTIFGNDTRLIVENQETQLLGSLRRRFAGERAEGRITALYGIEGRYLVALSHLSYALRDDVELKIGYLAIGGSRQSLLGQFAANDEVFVRLRYSF